MIVEITHIKRSGGRIVELGAMLGRHVIWRKTTAEVIALYRAGLRFILKPRNGEHALEVVVKPGTLQTEPELGTVADKAFDKKLSALPEFS